MKNLVQILEQQQPHLEFKNGKVIYSSVSVQGDASTIEEAINAIVPADK